MHKTKYIIGKDIQYSLDYLGGYKLTSITLLHGKGKNLKLYKFSNIKKTYISKNFLKIVSSEQCQVEHWFDILNLRLIILRGDFSERC